MGKQLVNFITCGCESSAPFCVIYKAGREPTPYFYCIEDLYIICVIVLLIIFVFIADLFLFIKLFFFNLNNNFEKHDTGLCIESIEQIHLIAAY
jgi:hypothetical protein